MATATCQHCGVKFVYDRANRRAAFFCSHACHGEARKGKERSDLQVKRKCLACGVPFSVGKSVPKPPNYCSMLCIIKAHIFDPEEIAAVYRRARAGYMRKWNATAKSKNEGRTSYDLAYRQSAEGKEKQLLRGRKHSLKKKFGISPETFARMIEACGGKCEICGKTLNLNPKREGNTNDSVNVDHCHITNRVRGILCRDCNTGLGLFGDNLARIRQALEYLEKTNSTDYRIAPPILQ
jgi:hypothetical protein